MEHARLVELIRAAHGERPAETLLTGARVLNVFTGELENGPVGLRDGFVTGLGEQEAERTVELDGGVLVPGLIDAHVHIESSMLTVPRFAEAVVPHGTTTVVTDAHEIANVLGTRGIDYVLDCADATPLDVFLMLPSCVPATPLETSGAALDADDLARYAEHPRVLGLGEMMNEPGVLHADAHTLAILEGAGGRRVDGHAAGLTGRDLATYAAAGIHSDHEATTYAEGLERLRLGMHLMVREGTAARNLDALLPLCRGEAAERCMYCTDDRHANDLLHHGHIDGILRRAIRAGVPALTAIRQATVYPCRYFGLKRRGAIAPGRLADLVLVDDLGDFRVRAVWKGGTLVAEAGERTEAWWDRAPEAPRASFDMRWTGAASLAMPWPGTDGTLARVIDVVPDQIVTRELHLEPRVVDGHVVPDTDRDLLPIACVERHRGTGNVGLGLVRGFGLARGALASSVAHDSHNVIAVGADLGDLELAVRTLRDEGGGLVVVEGGSVRAFLPLPVAGLVSDRPLAEIAAGADRVIATAHALGSPLADPFMTLSFLALPPIPELKISDRGLVDATRFELVPLAYDG